MRLKQITVQSFRNFVDPQNVEIEDDVTCLVGKNESRKTTLLKALHRLRPANGGLTQVRPGDRVSQMETGTRPAGH